MKTIIQSKNDDDLFKIKNLKEQGIATDLEGIDDIIVVGTDLITVSLIYPESGGE